MPNVKDLLRKIESGDISYEEKLAALSQVEASLQELKAKKEERVKFNVQLIIDEINKIRQETKAQLDYARSIVPERGPKGDQGDRGLDGAPGRDGADGKDGRDGRDGKDGQDGVSVTDAKIDFDGSLVITLSTGREINVGEVVAADLAEKIKVTMSTNGAVAVQDEGTTLTTGVKNINFVGANVTATSSGDSVTVNVSAGTGSVTSVDVSGGTTGLTTSGGPVTTSGTITLAGTLSIANGGTGQTTQTAAFDALSPLTTKGDLIAHNGTNDVRLAVGTNGYVLTADSSAASGIAWAAAGSARVVAVANATSITINADTTDIATQANTQAAGTLTINAPTGTLSNGQKLLLRLTSTNVQTFSWNGVFAGSTDLALPSASSGSGKVDYLGFIYNSTATKWHLIAKNFGF